MSMVLVLTAVLIAVDGVGRPLGVCESPAHCVDPVCKQRLRPYNTIVNYAEDLKGAKGRSQHLY